MKLICEYPLMVRELDGNFYVICKSLGLICENADLLSAYNEMKKLQIATIERFKRLDLTPSQPNDESKSSTTNMFRSELLPFFIKVSFLVILSGLCFMLISKPIVRSLNQAVTAINNASNNMSNSISSVDKGKFKINYLVNRFSEKIKDFPEEKKQEFRSNLRVIVKEMQPYVNELRPLWSEEASDISKKSS